MTVAPLTFNRWKLTAAQKKIPSRDLSGAQYDGPGSVVTSDVLVLLSTPRSGSTLLCELLRLNQGCLAHEYFQPFQYMQILAQRWGCIRAGTLDAAAYARALARYRTLSNGWLGINVHGTHLKYFSRVQDYFPGARFHYVRLVRRDQIAQAVSYEIAQQSRQWSSEFEARSHAQYTYSGIARKLRAIQHQDILLQSYLQTRGVPFRTITYEEMVADLEGTLRGFACIPDGLELNLEPPIRCQSDDQSTRWKQRFATDLVGDPSAYGSGNAAARLQQLINRQRLRMSGISRLS
ncbi:MAG: Stf0 family sulfotransferase [Mycobacterium sp.]|nr:Stf0 family sulfotransferase [Mycobacterium sp.]